MHLSLPCANLRGMADLSTKDVADRYGVLDATVRLWRRRGLFPHAYEAQTPRGPVWLIPEKDLRNFKPPKRGRIPKQPQEKAA